MDKIKALVKYNKAYLENIDKMDKMLNDIVVNMEEMILRDIAKALKENKAGSQIAVTDKLYRAEFWKDRQEELYGQKDKMLDKFFKIYKKDIDDLKKLYPEQNFSMSSVDYQLQQFDNFLKNDLDILKLMGVTETEAKGLVRMAQFGSITDSEYLIKVIERNLDKPIAHLRTRLYTTQSVAYRKNRNNFFRTIKEGGKKYIYVGPNDGLTRPFCAKNLGKIKTESEWKNTPNGQIGSAWIFGGGYNCRHTTLLVTNNWNDEEVSQLQSDFEV